MTTTPPHLSPDADTHLYIDMSGSIRYDDWFPVIIREVESMKKQAAELGVPLKLRLTAFSHLLADDAPVIEVTASTPTEDELRRLVDRMPRASGGTDFSLIYNHITADPERSARHNLIVSDLEWFTTPEAIAQEHPEHLDYLTIASAYVRIVDSFRQLLDRAALSERHTIR